MPRLAYRKIYGDDNTEMSEGSLVLVNRLYTRVIYSNEMDEIDIADFPWEVVETIENLPDNRFVQIDDSIMHTA